MKKSLTFLLACTLFLSMSVTAFAGPIAATSRIKDVAKVQGVRNNQLIGYGLVVGLAGSGDTNKMVFTNQALSNMLKAFGMTVNSPQMQLKNVAAVMVTAQLPPFVKPGDTIDITVSSMGDAKSLQGGTLLQTPLQAANGAVYAVGQGPLSVGGFSLGSGGSSRQKNFPTAGSIPGGAIVEREVPTQFSDGNTVMLALNQPDFTTASRIADALNYRFGSGAYARDPGTVVVNVPGSYTNNVVGFVASLEELAITPDSIAKIVINERTGTVVLGSNVTIDEVAVAQGSLTVTITSSKEVSQPPPFSYGSTVVTENKNITVDEQKGSLIVLPASSQVGDVVNALNAVGATPRDIISILQAMKAAGALHAELQLI